MRIFSAALAVLCFASSASAAGFEWGADCDAGEGEFTQLIPYRATDSVGVVPEGKKDVEILLNSEVDVDVQLIDVATGTELIAWPNGILSGASEECGNYEGLFFCYSGYNGGQTTETYGNEWIRLNGATNREVEMRVYGYASGDATVSYRFNPLTTCNEKGDGSFEQPIAYRDTVIVGDVPAGKTNVDIELDAAAGADVDVQLWDGNTAIVAWPNGLLSGSGEETVTYNGMTITYSGYNGRGGNWGHEQIQIRGQVSSTLTVKAYGYQQGTAAVDYQWGVGAGATCGGIAALQCEDAMFCKEWMQGGIADASGVCHTEDWCFDDESAAEDCDTLFHPAVPGSWGCSDTFTCEWEPAECEIGPDDTYVSTDKDQCALIRYTCDVGQGAFSNECGCGCECPEFVNCMPSPNSPSAAACQDTAAFYEACPNSQIAW